LSIAEPRATDMGDDQIELSRNTCDNLLTTFIIIYEQQIVIFAPIYFLA